MSRSEKEAVQPKKYRILNIPMLPWARLSYTCGRCGHPNKRWVTPFKGFRAVVKDPLRRMGVKCEDCRTTNLIPMARYPR